MCKYANVKMKKPNTLKCAYLQIGTSAHLYIIL
jgi:hypothetical protein